MKLKEEKGLNLIVSCLLACFLFVACSGEEQLPADILPMDKMVQITADVELLEAYLVSVKKSNAPDSVAEQQYELLLSKHELSKEEYRKSMKYYMDDRVQLRELYTKVLEELNAREAELKLDKKRHEKQEKP